MSTESERFRMRARQRCELAAVAKDAHSRETLTQMAAELDAEADAIEADTALQIPFPPLRG